MKSDTKAPKRRPAAKKAKPIAAQVIPKRNHKASPAERRQFCALVATDMNPRDAYACLRPETSPSGSDAYGYAWAKEMAVEIAALKEAAAQAAGQAHGITQAWVLGELKEMYMTPLARIDSESRFCKKYKVTETMTDAGPKTTIEVEKDSPHTILQSMAKQAGLEPVPVKAVEQAGQAQATVKDLMASLIQPGSPIARELARRAEARRLGAGRLAG